MDNLKIKDNIRKIRESRNITQEDVALGLDISLTAYRDLETGSTQIVNKRIAKLADILGTSTEEIVLGYQPVQNSKAKFEEMRAEYEVREVSLRDRITALEKLVDSLEETIRTKNEIITMLKKSLDQAK